MANKDNPQAMPDRDLDRMLKAASEPPRILGAEQRMMQRIAASRGRSASLPEQTSRFAWLAGSVPLAASLALGIYLGAQGVSTESIGLTGQTDIAGYDEDLSGMSEADAIAEEELI
jgi:hypothetical protein